MRLIQLMNPVFQMNNKLTGKRILENMELTNTVAEGNTDQENTTKQDCLLSTKC